MSSGSITIPMGQPDAYFYGNPSTPPGNFTPYVAGNGGGTEGSDHTGLIYAHSSAPDHAMGSTDTGSFIHLDQVGYNSDMIAAYSFGPYYMRPAGTLDNGPAIPADATSVSFSLTLTSRSETTDHVFSADVYFYDETKTRVGSILGADGFDGTTAWTTATGLAHAVTDSAVLQAINAGRMTVFFTPVYPHTYDPPAGADDFAYLAANFTWTTATRVRTWLREVQRGGDKAGAPVRTVQNNSRQASLRNIAFR